MTDTTRLKLPLLAASQAEKHVTVNEALTILDLFAGIINVASRASSSPPGSPADGDIYILSVAGSGDWAGYSANDLAICIDGAWRRVLAAANMVASIADEASLLVYYDGSAWGGLPLSTFAGQLAFPATQNPSAGANVLDDYEEGTWTPVLSFGGASTGITYGSPTLGRYTKVGRKVTASAVITLSSKGTATGNVQLTALPFASLNDQIFASGSVGWASGFSSVVGAVMCMVQPNSSKVNFYQSNNGAPGILSNANFSNTSSLYFTVTYETT